MFFLFRRREVYFLSVFLLIPAFSFVYGESEFLQYARNLSASWVISKQSNENNYRLSSFISRAEVIKIAVRLSWKDPKNCTTYVYTDVNTVLWDLCWYIEQATKVGMIKWWGKFRPYDFMTRAELAKVLVKAVGKTSTSNLNPYDDVGTSLWDLTWYISTLKESWCISRGSRFYPNAPATRGEVFKIASCLVDKKQMTTATTVVNTNTPSLWVCWTANGELYSVAPNVNLCAKGTASKVSWSGPWTWSCSGTNGWGKAICTTKSSVTRSQATSCGAKLWNTEYVFSPCQFNGSFISSQQAEFSIDFSIITSTVPKSPIYYDIWTHIDNFPNFFLSWTYFGWLSEKNEAKIHLVVHKEKFDNWTYSWLLAVNVNNAWDTSGRLWFPVNINVTWSDYTKPTSLLNADCWGIQVVTQKPSFGSCKIWKPTQVSEWYGIDWAVIYTWTCEWANGWASQACHAEMDKPQLNYLAGAYECENPTISCSSIFPTHPYRVWCRFVNGLGREMITCAKNPIDATCWWSNNTLRSAAPTQALCLVGNPSKVTGDNPWKWTCSGGESKPWTVASCSASK